MENFIQMSQSFWRSYWRYIAIKHSSRFDFSQKIWYTIYVRRRGEQNSGTPQTCGKDANLPTHFTPIGCLCRWNGSRPSRNPDATQALSNLHISILKSLCKMPIDKLQKMWYNNNVIRGWAEVRISERVAGMRSLCRR